MDDAPVAVPVNKDFNHLISVQIQRRLALVCTLLCLIVPYRYPVQPPNGFNLEL